MSNEKVWVLRDTGTPEADARVSALAAETGLLPVTARLLYNRGCQTAEAIGEFLSPDAHPELFHDPFLMKDMRTATDRIRRAIDEHTRIVIYGDYAEHYSKSSQLYVYERNYEGKKLLVICSFTEKPVRFDAPDGIELKEQAQVFGNYDANFVIANGFTSRPYEMRVYLFNEKD